MNSLDEDEGDPLGEVEGNPLDEVEGNPLGRAHYRLPRHARRLSLSSSPEKGRARCKGGEEGIRRGKWISLNISQRIALILLLQFALIITRRMAVNITRRITTAAITTAGGITTGQAAMIAVIAAVREPTAVVGVFWIIVALAAHGFTRVAIILIIGEWPMVPIMKSAAAFCIIVVGPLAAGSVKALWCGQVLIDRVVGRWLMGIRRPGGTAHEEQDRHGRAEDSSSAELLLERG